MHNKTIKVCSTLKVSSLCRNTVSEGPSHRLQQRSDQRPTSCQSLSLSTCKTRPISTADPWNIVGREGWGGVFLESMSTNPKDFLFFPSLPSFNKVTWNSPKHHIVKLMPVTKRTIGRLTTCISKLNPAEWMSYHLSQKMGRLKTNKQKGIITVASLRATQEDVAIDMCLMHEPWLNQT